MVSQLSTAITAAVPVVTGQFLTLRESGSVELGPREDIVSVWTVTPPIDQRTQFVERRFFVQIVLAVKLFDVLRYHDTLRIEPRTRANAIPCVHGSRAGAPRSTQVGAPGSASGTRCGRQ